MSQGGLREMYTGSAQTTLNTLILLEQRSYGLYVQLLLWIALISTMQGWRWYLAGAAKATGGHQPTCSANPSGYLPSFGAIGASDAWWSSRKWDKASEEMKQQTKSVRPTNTQWVGLCSAGSLHQGEAKCKPSGFRSSRAKVSQVDCITPCSYYAILHQLVIYCIE